MKWIDDAKVVSLELDEWPRSVNSDQERGYLKERIGVAEKFVLEELAEDDDGEEDGGGEEDDDKKSDLVGDDGVITQTAEYLESLTVETRVDDTLMGGVGPEFDSDEDFGLPPPPLPHNLQTISAYLPTPEPTSELTGNGHNGHSSNSGGYNSNGAGNDRTGGPDTNGSESSS